MHWNEITGDPLGRGADLVQLQRSGNCSGVLSTIALSMSGCSGLFLDPDGHPWEIAHNPHWTVTEDGGVRLG